jgi:two-component system response regulator DesR
MTGIVAAIESGGRASGIRVVLAEDQAMVLGALAALLEISGGISVVGRAQNGADALARVIELKPDVFITDIEMPEMSGLDVAAELQRRKTRTKVIIVTTFARSGYLRRALDAGATGYLLKDKPAEQLAEAVRRVHRGLRVIDPELAAESWGTADPLTDRDQQARRVQPDRGGADRAGARLALGAPESHGLAESWRSRLAGGNAYGFLGAVDAIHEGQQGVETVFVEFMGDIPRHDGDNCLHRQSFAIGAIF